MAQQPEISTHFFEYGIAASLWCSHWIGINSDVESCDIDGTMEAPDGSTESHLGSTSRQKTCSYFDLCEGPKKISKERTFVQKAHFPKRRLMIYDDLLIHF
jgi:hypothetical protein